MKKIQLLFFVLSIATMGFSQTTNKKEFHIILANWDGWGRTSKDCRGFGLCNFTSCTFCCTENDVIVNCNDKQIIPNAGIISMDPETKEGFLTITLSPVNETQRQAIEQKLALYLDTDLTSDTITLVKARYAFDPSVGKYGGYRVQAFEK